MSRELICISCPMGCRLTVTENPECKAGFKVSGNTCKRGEIYAIKEVTAPERTLTSTVKIEGAKLKRLPVITKGSIPKEKMFEIMNLLNEVVVKSPIREGDVIVENLVLSGIDLVASRTM